MIDINNSHINKEGGNFNMMKQHRHPGGHIPPHERRALIHLDLSEDDMILFKRVYGNDDEAAAAARVLMDAPPEIQIIAAQLISFIEEVA